MAESIKKIREPRDHQRGMTWHDQHGRAWNGLFEMEGAKGPDNRSVIAWIQIAPHRWTSPIDIPTQVLKLVYDEQGEQVFGRLEVDYRQWKSENAQGRSAWQDRLQLIAKRMFPNNYGEAIRNPTVELLVEVGPAPVPLEFIEAAEVGNKWALGLRKPNGEPYPRPAWVTDDLLATRDALKRATGWKAGAEDLGPVDASKYPDAEEVEDNAALVPAGVVEDEEDVDYTPPKRRRR